VAPAKHFACEFPQTCWKTLRYINHLGLDLNLLFCCWQGGEVEERLGWERVPNEAGQAFDQTM
jgi:hypothetical protein